MVGTPPGAANAAVTGPFRIIGVFCRRSNPRSGAEAFQSKKAGKTACLCRWHRLWAHSGVSWLAFRSYRNAGSDDGAALLPYNTLRRRRAEWTSSLINAGQIGVGGTAGGADETSLPRRSSSGQKSFIGRGDVLRRTLEATGW